MSDNSLQDQIKLVHEDLIGKFMELKRDNQGIKMRLGKIEAKLDVDAGYNDENGEKQQKKQLVSEEKLIVSEEKLIVSEERLIVSEEKPLVAEEDPIVAEEKPMVAEEKLSVSEERQSKEDKPKIKSTLDKTKDKRKRVIKGLVNMKVNESTGGKDRK